MPTNPSDAFAGIPPLAPTTNWQNVDSTRPKDNMRHDVFEDQLREIEEELAKLKRDSMRRRSSESLRRIGSSSSISSARSNHSAETNRPASVDPEPRRISVDSQREYKRSSVPLFGVSSLLSSRQSSRDFDDTGDSELALFQEEQRQKRLSRQKIVDEVLSPTGSSEHLPAPATDKEENDSTAALSSSKGSRADGIDRGSQNRIVQRMGLRESGDVTNSNTPECSKGIEKDYVQESSLSTVTMETKPEPFVELVNALNFEESLRKENGSPNNVDSASDSVVAGNLDMISSQNQYSDLLEEKISGATTFSYSTDHVVLTKVAEPVIITTVDIPKVAPERRLQTDVPNTILHNANKTTGNTSKAEERTSADFDSLISSHSPSILETATTVAPSNESSKLDASAASLHIPPVENARTDDLSHSSSSQPSTSPKRSILERIIPSWRGPSTRRPSISSPTSPDQTGAKPSSFDESRESSRSASVSPTKSKIGGSVRDLIARAEKRDTSSSTESLVSPTTIASKRVVSSPLPLSEPSKAKEPSILKSTTFSTPHLKQSSVPATKASSSYPSEITLSSSLTREKALFRIKGKRRMYFSKVPFTPQSINSVDVFILENPAPHVPASPMKGKLGGSIEFATLYVWVGSGATKVKKAKALEVANRLKDKELRTKANIIVIDGEDADFEKNMDTSLVLYGLKDNSEEFSIIAPSGKSVSSKLVNSGGVFILECAIYLERDAGESVFFMELFPDWSDGVTIEVKAPRNVQVKDRSRYVYDRGGFSIPTVESIDVYKMLHPPPPPASWDRPADGADIEDPGGPPPIQSDLGKISLEAFVASGSEISALPESEYGILHSGEAYYFLYKHLKGRPGNEKEIRKQATIAYRASEVEKTLGCRNVQGDAEDCIRIVEAKWKISSLTRGSCFVAVLKDKSFIWVGNGSFESEKRYSRMLAERLGIQNIEKLKKGKNLHIFWQKLGGKDSVKQDNDEYASLPYLLKRRDMLGTYTTRLFRISHVVNGCPTAEEITPFSQSDLKSSSVYILDAFFEFYVWVGADARSNYKDLKLSLETILEYAEEAVAETPARKIDGETVWLVKSGEETVGFKSCFVAFDDGSDEYTGGGFLDMLKRTGSLKSKKRLQPKAESVSALLEKMKKSVHSLEELRRKDDLPLGVNPAHLEQYLSPADFQKVFKTDPSTFAAYPVWKQSDLKKKGIIPRTSETLARFSFRISSRTRCEKNDNKYSYKNLRFSWSRKLCIFLSNDADLVETRGLTEWMDDDKHGYKGRDVAMRLDKARKSERSSNHRRHTTASLSFERRLEG
ncbi:hypothetical protein BC829DRAFT_435453 [Chytridium lagenaria]|nr:hypothetical protein BC829DRAFT_435453 [Chytridium lagenaria]